MLFCCGPTFQRILQKPRKLPIVREDWRHMPCRRKVSRSLSLFELHGQATQRCVVCSLRTLCLPKQASVSGEFFDFKTVTCLRGPAPFGFQNMKSLWHCFEPPPLREVWHSSWWIRSQSRIDTLSWPDYWAIGKGSIEFLGLSHTLDGRNPAPVGLSCLSMFIPFLNPIIYIYLQCFIGT